MSKYLIAVDVGTQGTKAVLFDTEMKVVTDAFEASKLISPTPGTLWQEADDLYGAVVRTIHLLMEKSGARPGEILAIGLDGQMAGMMGIDAQGEASTVYDSWLDTRCAPFVDVMRNRAGKRLVEITGGPVTCTHGPKILWLKENHPDLYAKTAKFVLPHGYIVGKMTGLAAEDAVYDHSCLPYSGFGDNARRQWSDELLDLFGVEKGKMARIASPFEIAGKTTESFAREAGIMAGIPVAVGAGDTSASVFGSGIFEEGMMLDCAGTASVLCSVVGSYVPDTQNETLSMVRLPMDDRWMPLAYINGGGLCLHWFRNQFGGGADYDVLDREAAAIAPCCEGVLFLPHFDGRVLPYQPNLKGSFVGLNWNHTRAHLFRAVMESVAFEYDYYLSILKRLHPNGKFTRLYSIGGGAKSRLFKQIKADVLGVEVTSFEMSDTSLVGSAVIAGVAAGVFDDWASPIQKVARFGETVKPDTTRHEAYRAAAGRYLDLIDVMGKFYEGE